jgi:hypothetical protein
MFLSLSLLTKGVFVFALILLTLGVLLLLAIPIWKAIRSQLSLSPVISIEAAKIGQDDVVSYLALRAKELGRGVRLDALYEIRVPPLADNFGSGEKFKLPEDFKFEFQGVDVWKIAGTVLKFLPDDRYTIKVEAVPGSGDAVRVEWKPPGGEPKVWLLRSEKADPADGKRMADRVVATILHYIYYDPNGPTEFRQGAPLAAALGEAAFPNARALEAYLVGQQYLNAYLDNTEDPAPLTNAEAEFRRLQKEMPEFVDGLMLLGVTLSEAQKESDALLAYKRAKVLIEARIKTLEAEIAAAPKAQPTGLDPVSWEAIKKALAGRKAKRIAAHKILFQAQVFQANAYRKLFRWQDFVRAITELDDVERRLSGLAATPLEGTTKNDKLEFKKIGAVASAEKANALGYGLILIYPDSFLRELKGLDAPATLLVLPDRRKELAGIEDDLKQPGAGKTAFDARNDAFVKEMGVLYQKQRKAIRDARRAVESIQMPQDASDAEKSAWDREQKRIEGLLLSADGYGAFRHANIAEPDTDEGNKRFDAQSREARDNIDLADARQPNQNPLLQTLGTIYGHPRFDARNQQIDVARRYFERSLKIKPDDFFSHQNLAMLAVRQAYASGLQISADALKTAIEHVNSSLKQRPGNGPAFVALAQLNALSWLIETDAERKKPWAAAYVAAIENVGRSTGASAAHLWTAKLQWGLMQLRAAAADPAPPAPASGSTTTKPPVPKKGEFSFEKDEYKKQLQAADEQMAKLPSWDARQLRRVVEDVTAKVNASASDQRDNLTWPSAVIQPAP